MSDADEIAALNEVIAAQRRVLREIKRGRAAQKDAAVSAVELSLSPSRESRELSRESREPRFASYAWYAAEVERLNDKLITANQQVLQAESRAQRAELEAQSLALRVRSLENEIEALIRKKTDVSDEIVTMQHALIEQRTIELSKSTTLIDALREQIALLTRSSEYCTAWTQS